MLDKGTPGYVKSMETLRGSTPVPKIGPTGGLRLSPSMLGFGAAFLNRIGPGKKYIVSVGVT